LARLIYTERALLDLERVTEFLRKSEPVAAEETSGLITEAIEVLRNHPFISRPADSGLRELVISRGKSGYLALYRFNRSLDAVVVLAIRHQREAGYTAVNEPEA
jgi:plasmid stabilization system protein ParE